MRFILLFLLFFGCSFGQNRPIEIKIDSITSIDSAEFLDREFTINYYIKNLSNNEVSFFLNTKRFIPSSASSMQHVTTYRLFQNEKPIDVSQVFTGQRTFFKYEGNDPKAFEEFMKNKKDSILLEFEKIKSDTLHTWKKKNKAIMSSIFVLKPNETKHFVQKLNWTKQRYYKSFDLEYYFDEESKYYLQLELSLMKKEFSDRLSEEEFENIMKNPNFIKGNYYSNKVEINFKE